jgi:hypothetical protein
MRKIEFFFLVVKGMSETELTIRFINGLKNYDLTKEEIKDWKYAGGGHIEDEAKNKLLNEKFKKKYPKGKIPDLVHHCVCGHRIKENAFITNGKQLLTLGNCCVKRFCETGTKKTCNKCGKLWRGKTLECRECQMSQVSSYIVNQQQNENPL